MSTRTTVTLDDDVLDRVRDESRKRGKSFRDTLNDLLRSALVTGKHAAEQRAKFRIKPSPVGLLPGLSYDDVEALIEYGEGPFPHLIVLDANILLYAYEPAAPQHAKVVQWLEKLFDGDELVGLSWQAIHAFLRIRTNRKLVATPKPEESFQIINEWLKLPNVVLVQPGPRHADFLRKLMETGAAYGPLVSDAVLAAIALEQGAALASTDRDFSRFPDLRWINPLD